MNVVITPRLMTQHSLRHTHAHIHGMGITFTGHNVLLMHKNTDTCTLTKLHEWFYVIEIIIDILLELHSNNKHMTLKLIFGYAKQHH